MSTVRVPRGEGRTRLLDAAVDIIRTKGLHATTVDELCAAAGATNGAFFHHWSSKEEMAVAAANHWSATTGDLFANADFHDHDDPAERVLAYLDLREQLVRGELPEFTCLVGTMAQEVYATDPAAALQTAGTSGTTTAASVARHLMVVIQGAFVVAKAANDPAIAHESIDHLRRYLLHLFTGPE